MKKILLFSGLFLLTTNLFAQIFQPVKWSYSSQKISDSEANVLITATIDMGWHIYSLHIPEGGPIPTSFKFNKSSDYTLIGKVTEPKPKGFYDTTYKMQIYWHSNKVTFTQKVKMNNPKAVVSGVLEFMVCNDERCLPSEEVEFTIPLNPGLSVADTPAKPTQSGSTGPVITNTFAGDVQTSAGFWGIFIAGFLGGLAAFLMPCIYPMVPLTISYFTKQSGSRAKGIKTAFLYGLSIILIYVSLGLLVTFLFGPSALNEAASSAVFNLTFFVILVIFAISFFGAFEITLPSSIVNKADEKSNVASFTGLFFMAFTLALVSFSCTGPIIGYLLVDSVSKGTYLGPAIGMFGFSLALAIPFTLFAIFPSWLKELPKSGSWLNTVKVSLGFLELALALKFLSNVDLAYHWEIFNRGIFLILWIIIFGILGIYLLTRVRFSSLKASNFPGLVFALLVLAFTVYLVPGLKGAPLTALSAWLPPPGANDLVLFSNSDSSSNSRQTAGKKYAAQFGSRSFGARYDIPTFFDYDQGMEYARNNNKPVLLDFTGWSCANCRRMEESVWVDPEVLKRLKKNYVLISLYVDDKTELAENEKYVNATGKKIKNIGQKWSDFEATRFNINSQPFYVIIGKEGKVLVPPQAFNLDTDNYISFLDSGIAAYSKQ